MSTGHSHKVKVKINANVVLARTNGVSPNRLPVIVASDRPQNHIVDTCPLTKFEGGLNLLHEADDAAVMESRATAANTKKSHKLR